jgi:acetyl-CoA carboxylase carboxyltransferase component
MGGAESVARHHAAGKLTARERIDKILDLNSFREIGALTGSAKYDQEGRLLEVTPANVVIGTGRIGKRMVVITAEDFTVRGGSSEAANSDKWIWAETLALETRVPLVRLVDTAGGSVKLLEMMGATKLPGYRTWRFTDILGIIPVASAAVGSVAGLGAVRVVGSHFSIMVKGTSQVFAAGPPVVEPATGVKIAKEELGGYRVHARGSGVVDNEAESEEDAFRQIRQFLSYLPSNVYQLPPRIEAGR